ncbi:polyadenylate-binding protein, cytoplasmic and nuclear, putative [Entamoeba invadens IP1]|uniref:Polyadenylate-binding protein, cytoplasmic and nuclear, putative n=1 Tax=Entamoeba invadens IP1 TaxID=370355 RepID=L7FKC4_ENTIV|nr:polyadenylate-binding protein, cytoplasmic and nuclear, putative [Entamoeba invadens IP1]ELP86374.1 polyadenylate-binding protein, cytoplasmic and nuclear, putative [Entamoeba invadens IP1]|eukprot:XP_004185720.1 polyadenylate-binding protein, cytoplasmic and nuclear, putative [Entamoeba invadens IP1]
MATTLFPDFDENKTVFVSGLTKNVTESLLYKEISAKFESQVASVHVSRNEHYDTAIAYVNMNTHEAAKKAIETMNGALIDGKPVNMFWSLKDFKQRTETQTNLFVKNIKKTVSQKEMQDVFMTFGEIISVKLSVNENGASNGFGYVKYRTIEAALKAVENAAEIKAKIGEDNFIVAKFEKQTKNKKTNLYVSNIDKSVNEEQFVKYFETFGPLRKNPDNKFQVLFASKDEYPTAMGFVDFENEEDAQKALTAPKNNVLGQGEIKVVYYMSKKERKREYQLKNNEIMASIKGKYKEFNMYVKTSNDSEHSTSDAEIRSAFADCGEIYSIRIKYFNKSPTDVAYVCFTSQEGYDKADKIGKELGWSVYKFKTRQERSSAYQILNNYPMNYAFFNQMMNFMSQNMQPYGLPGMYPPQGQQQRQRINPGNTKKTRQQKSNNEPRSRPVPKKEEYQEEPISKPVPKPQEQVTDEMKNDLGEALYSFIDDLHMFSDEETVGRITGILLESVPYGQLKEMSDNAKDHLKEVVMEIEKSIKGADAN